MNREPNKEIDILLRKLSGKQNGNIAAADGNSSANAPEHLDADELNAYAENALPASLRSRYTEHLADCSSCRKIVTQLSFSSTAAIAQTPVEERAPSGLKTFLASLISPMVIRYAVPAMAVLLVVAIAWIVVRRESTYDQVATIVEQRQQEPRVEQPNAPTAAAPTTNEPAQVRKAESTGPSGQPQPTPAEGREAETSAGRKAQEESKAGDVVAKKDEPAKDEAAPPPVAAAPATGAGIAQAKTASEVNRNEPDATKKKAEVDAANNQNVIQQQQERRLYDQRSGPSEPKAVQRGQRSNNEVGNVSRGRAKLAEPGADKETSRDDQAETRTVGGHRFIKRGKIWIDALYESDSATTNVSRGSDQYRSLMGDEPGLRTIVDQLSGEIIVVWKSRAYRIR